MLEPIAKSERLLKAATAKAKAAADRRNGYEVELSRRQVVDINTRRTRWGSVSLWLFGELLEDGGEFPGLLDDAAAAGAFAAAGFPGVAVDGPEGEAANQGCVAAKSRRIGIVGRKFLP
jgi:hypothetical protein